MNKKPASLEHLERLSTPEPTTGCWLWLGSVTNAGYGQVGRLPNRMSAHRAAAIARHGQIPEDMVAMHSCNQKLCVNPAHINIGTQSENLRSAARDGLMPHLKRFHVGTDNPASKLTPEDVRSIREANGFYREIAERFGLHTSTIAKIKTRQTWRHVT